MTNNKKTGFEVHIMGFVFTLIAGWVNTIALYVFLSENPSFLTGRVAKLGEHILMGNKTEIKKVSVIIVFFVFGAFLSALITQKTGLSHGLYFSGAIMILTVIAFYISEDTLIAYITLPMCMGAQNAATSLTSISRTTHLTGPFTDIGINFARGNWRQGLFWILRGLAFLIGAISAYFIVNYFAHKEMALFKALIPPAAIIIIAAFLQKRLLKIELH